MCVYVGGVPVHVHDCVLRGYVCVSVGVCVGVCVLLLLLLLLLGCLLV